MEEPKNNLSCTYLGCVYVDKPGGMETLRPAIEKVSHTVPEEKWLAVMVNISPASFTVCSDNVSDLTQRDTSIDSFLHSSRNRKIIWSIVGFVISRSWVSEMIPGEFHCAKNQCFSTKENI